MRTYPVCAICGERHKPAGHVVESSNERPARGAAFEPVYSDKSGMDAIHEVASKAIENTF